MLALVAAAAAGAVNAIAGGGTLLTFPAIVGLGVTPLVANATSTVALWPGSLGSMWGYRRELGGARRWVIGFAAPSLVGGALGAWLLLHTPPAAFDRIVPFLVLGATVLFLLQGPLLRRLRPRSAGASDRAAAVSESSDAFLPSLRLNSHTANSTIPTTSAILNARNSSGMKKNDPTFHKEKPSRPSAASCSSGLDMSDSCVTPQPDVME